MPNAPQSALVTPRQQRWPARAFLAVATAAAVALFVTAGNWQRARMQAKEALRAQYDVAMSAAAVTLASLDEPDWPALRYRPVAATGEFDRAHQIYIDNRVRSGMAGYDVVAPLELIDGRHVLVDRGWIAQGASRSTLPDAPPPAGRVTVRGRISVPAGSYFELSRVPAEGPLWQHLDPVRFSEATGVAVLPAVIEQTIAAAPHDSLLRDRPEPDFGADRHRVYMVQWYLFAALALGLWIFFTVRGLRAPKRSANG